MKFKNKKRIDGGHLIATVAVILCLVAKVDGKTIPIEINQFRNSHLGIKPLNYTMGTETDKSNRLEKERLEKELKEAKENPYYSEKYGIRINVVGYITMVFA